jgi:DNA-directed RNA polymerase subunit RPC12/RpoP
VPCYRCGAIQVDPARGPSPWKRGVIDDTQVLVCPECQRTHDWVADLDRCATCGSTMLVRVLGETRCRACGWTRESLPTRVVPAPTDLAAEVAAAVERVLGRAGPT